MINSRHETVPCKYCGRPTPYTGTRECDPCHGATQAPTETLRKILAESEQWTAYKPGDEVPVAQYYWVAVRPEYGECTGPVVCSRFSGSFVHDDERVIGIDSYITHYITIATPELTK